MNSFRRLIMRGSDCVGVIVGLDQAVTLIVEISGSPESVDQFRASIPQEAETVDHWFNALDELLPMTYRIGPPVAFVATNGSAEAATQLAEEHIVAGSNSRRLTTTRVEVTGRMMSTQDSPSDPDGAGNPLSNITDTVQTEDVPSLDGAAEPAVTQNATAAPEFVARPQTQQVLRSLADDGAGLLDRWFLLLEDWHGLTAIFAGDRTTYAVYARAATSAMSQQIADAVPDQASNLEHWVTSLVRSLPAGMWLRSFTDARVLGNDPQTPAQILQATVNLFGTPAPQRSHELVATGDINGSLDVETPIGTAKPDVPQEADGAETAEGSEKPAS